MNAVSSQPAAFNHTQVTAGLRLVESIVGQLLASIGCVLPKDEMVSLGNEGLVNAMIRFDPERGVEFNAFASPRIRGAIIDGMRREGRMPRRAWARASDDLRDCQIGPAEYDDEVLLDDTFGLSPEEVAIQCEESNAVFEVIDELAPQHAQLVRRHYGEGKNLQAISRELGFAPGWGSKAMATVHDRIRRGLDRHDAKTGFVRAAPVQDQEAPGSLEGGSVCMGGALQTRATADSCPCHPRARGGEAQGNRLPVASQAGPAQHSRLSAASEAGPGQGSRLSAASGAGMPQGMKLPNASEAGPGQGSSLSAASEAGPAQYSRLSVASEAGPGQGSRLPNASEAGPGQGMRLPNASEAGMPQGMRLPNASEAGPGQGSRLSAASECAAPRITALQSLHGSAARVSHHPRSQKSTEGCRLHAIRRPLWPIGRSETRGTQRAAFQPKRTIMSNNDIVTAILARRNVNKAAYQTILPEAQGLQASLVRVLNADVSTIVPRVVGAVPRILAMREEAQRQTPQVQFHKFQKLETYAFALSEAHVHCLSISRSPDELRALAEEGNASRDIFRADAVALGKRGLIDASRLEACQGQPGYKVVSLELQILVEVFQDNWPKIKGKCGISEEELDRAIAVSQALVAFVGAREQSPEAKASAIDIRDRMFTLLVDNYDEARRMATFLRWRQGDVDELVPSLFAGKNRRRTEEEEEKDPNNVSPLEPGNQNTSPVNTNPASNNTTAAPVPGNGLSNVTPVNQMFSRPNSDPFMR